MAPKLSFRVPAEDDPATRIRLKLEINTTETKAFDPPLTVRFDIENPWFSGGADVATFSREEMLATKLRGIDEITHRHGGRVYVAARRATRMRSRLRSDHTTTRSRFTTSAPSRVRA